jgi:very-short-patch-repair endonuclease
MRDDTVGSRPFAKELRRTLTDAETILWSRLQGGRLSGAKFRRQHPIGPYIADFACREVRLIVEVDGATHASAEERAHDARRTDFLKSQGWDVLRVNNDDVYRNLIPVLDTIFAHLKARGFQPQHPLRPAAPDTSPARRGRKDP